MREREREREREKMFYFLIFRPTYFTSVSMTVSLIFPFATCGCFRRNDGIGGPRNDCK